MTTIRILRTIQVITNSGETMTFSVPQHLSDAQIIPYLAQTFPGLDTLLASNTAWQTKRSKEDAMRTKWLASPLAGKTPAQVKTAVENAVNGWGSLAAAKADMVTWFPLLFAAMAALIEREMD